MQNILAQGDLGSKSRSGGSQMQFIHFSQGCALEIHSAICLFGHFPKEQ